ncbi:hypothetical protein [Candidatus Phytoplasma meliae]|uniref:Uncharacterized protein n=1 Tax=Candidatus Phytoplasma meliae TaxID=1848402 RepID=A0ABS5CXR3_9MOLU|nr:hypothetical protein [Candidatus Phytoplasma meliae]MBP5835761.1 hypothetical protein [Candidatus Phytoplasma meliae]
MTFNIFSITIFSIILKIVFIVVPIVLLIKSLFGKKNIETKRFLIEDKISSIHVLFVDCSDNKLKEKMSIRINFIKKRINDFEKNKMYFGDIWTVVFIGMFTNRQYNLINGELDKHLFELNQIEALLNQRIKQKIERT